MIRTTNIPTKINMFPSCYLAPFLILPEYVAPGCDNLHTIQFLFDNSIIPVVLQFSKYCGLRVDEIHSWI